MGAIEAIRSSGIAWTDCTIGFVRSVPMAWPDWPTGCLAVNVLGMAGRDGRSIDISVDVFDPKNRSCHPTPRLDRQIRQTLRDCGYSLQVFHAPGSRRALKNMPSATKRVSTATVAVQECARIIAKFGVQARRSAVASKKL